MLFVVVALAVALYFVLLRKCYLLSLLLFVGLAWFGLLWLLICCALLCFTCCVGGVVLHVCMLFALFCLLRGTTNGNQ